MYRYILKAIGYNHNDYTKLLKIERVSHDIYHATPQIHKRNYFIKYQNIVIIIILLWRFPYTVYLAKINKDIMIIYRNIFYFMFPFQYKYGIDYFKNNYYRLIHNKFYNKFLIYSIPLSCFTSLCIIATEIYYMSSNPLFINKFKINPLFKILMIFELFFSYTSFLINTNIFIMNIIYRKISISEYYDNINKYIKNSMMIEKKIKNISVEYSMMKEQYNFMVESVTPFFSTLNFFGFISMYYYILLGKDKQLIIVEWINIVLFLLIEGIFIYCINSLNFNISSISSILTSNSIFTSYTTTLYTNNRISRNIDNKQINSEKSNKQFNKNSSTRLDKLLIHTQLIEQLSELIYLKSIIDIKWDSFTLFGMEINDTVLITKIIGIVFAVLISSELKLFL
jgi:hypothetical protein